MFINLHERNSETYWLTHVYITLETISLTSAHGVRHGFKRGGGPKPLLNLKVSQSLILIYINYLNFWYMLLSTKNALGY